MADLREAVTLYLPDDVDRQHVGRLVDAMCRLNGIPVAIELHATERDSRVPASTTATARDGDGSGRTYAGGEP